MYIIVTYDVGEKRVGKVCKRLKKYLIWSQNSVFEGEITKGTLSKCMTELEKIIDKSQDSIHLYQIDNPNHIKKRVFGIDKSFDEIFL